MSPIFQIYKYQNFNYHQPTIYFVYLKKRLAHILRKICTQ